MPSIPLIVVWFAVLSGYLPYSMGYAFLNPLILIGYGLLGWLVGANIPTVRHALAGSTLTTLLAILVTNVSSGNPHVVLPSGGILLSSLLLSGTGVLASHALRVRWLRQGLEPGRIQFILRGGFGFAALLLYLNGYLPYEWKMWIASHTTNFDLALFSVTCSLGFLLVWRLAQAARS